MNQFKTIIEGKTKIIVPAAKKISKELPVFYNPIMKFNRDLSIFVLNALCMKDIQIALPLSGTGARAVRFLNELNTDMIKLLYINDYDTDAISIIKKNIKINKFKEDLRVNISKDDANIFMMKNFGFDYIDIDPFGSPNPFLDSAITRISRNGILAITATDTAPLCGTYPKVCNRKYWAKPIRNHMMHEMGLRILVRKIQLQGANYDKALIPILSYSKDHYFRVFFRCIKGKEKCDEVLSNHKYFLHCPKCSSKKISKYNKLKCCNCDMEFVGPVWTGNLYDSELLQKIAEAIPENYEDDKFIQLLLKEAEFENANQSKNDEINRIGIYDYHAFSRLFKIRLLNFEELEKKLAKKKKSFTRSHLGDTLFWTNGSVSDIIDE